MKKNNGLGTSRIVPAALLLGAASLGSRVVGLLRERMLATTFGATNTFDAFIAAFRLPDLVFNLIVIGALSASFIPLFTEKLFQKNNGEQEAFRFANAVLNSILLVVVIFCLVYALCAPVIVPLITPGFSADQMHVTITLTRIMALQPLFLAVSFVFSGILNSYKRFFVYALAPIVYNLGIILGIMVAHIVPRVGVAAVAVGVVVGAVLHMLVQLPSVWRLGFRWKPYLLREKEDMRVLWRMILPRVVGLGAQQINLFIVTILGSGLLAGSISAFHLANNVQYLPVGIFGIAFAQAAFPTLAEHRARKNTQAFLDTLSRSFRYILFFVIPLSVLFFLFRAQMIRVLFGDGAFDWQDTIMTFETFGWLILSLFAQATIPLLTRAFYVEQDTKTPVIISLISVAVNIVLAILLAPRYGVQGLAAAFSVSAIINLVLLLGRLHWHYEGFNDREILKSLVRISCAAVVAGICAQALKYPIAAIVNMQKFWGIFTQLVVAGGGGMGAYLLMCWFLKCEELQVIKRYFPKKWQSFPSTDTPRFSGLPD